MIVVHPIRLLRAIGRGIAALLTVSDVQRLGRELRKLGGVAGNRAEPPYIVREDVVVLGTVVRVNDEPRVELVAKAVVPSTLRFLVSRHWGDRSQPALPIRRPTQRALVDAIDRACEGEHALLLWCDGKKTVCQMDLRVAGPPLDAVIDALVAIARFDDGLTDVLLSLPGAVVLRGHELDPAVSFAEDSLVIGVRDRAEVVAQLDGFPATRAKATVRDGEVDGDGVAGDTRALLAKAGDGDLLVTSNAARFTWSGVERDRERLFAGVRALRSLRPVAGPYR